MPRKSKTDNVRKICDCAGWKTCTHPWYLDYQRDKVRYRDNLDVLTGRHAKDFVEAKDEARRAIVAKLNGHDPKGLVPSDDPTLEQLLKEYDRERPRRDMWQAGRIAKTELPSPNGLRRFGDWRVSAITSDTLRQFRRLRPPVAANRDLAFLAAAFNWAVAGGLMARSPFRVGDVTVVKLTREEPRSRRLQMGEDERLLTNAGGLHDIITAALETGMRRGEILSLQWGQVRLFPRAEIFLPATRTKTKRDRRVPVSTVLRAILERRKTDPAGETLPPDAYVFGDEVGRRRVSIKTAWKLTLKRANRAADEAKLPKIEGLRFHDLRREAGSRWMDAGIPLATIQRWLGHTNISQTSTYLGASLGGDEQDMRYFEEKIGRIQPLTQIDVSGDTDGSQPSSSDTALTENTEQNLIVH
jgi:integrase